jgi:hypothetical protein
MRRSKRVPIWAKKHKTQLPTKSLLDRRKVATILWLTGALFAFGMVILNMRAGRSDRLPPYVWLAMGIVAIMLLWKLPKIQVARSEATTREKLFDRENEARKTLAQILGGMFVLAGLYSSLQAFNLSREGQITDRFTKAIEQLGALDGTGKPKLEVRLGGIYSLERIARDSDRDGWVIMEVLTAYIREHSSLIKEDGKKIQEAPNMIRTPAGPPIVQPPNVDIQAILTILSRRRWSTTEESWI